MAAELAIAARQQRRAESAERRLERQERARLRRVAAAAGAVVTAANADPVRVASAPPAAVARPGAEPAPATNASHAQPGRCRGTVKWFSDAKGYGFIRGDNGRDVFVHCSALASAGYRTLIEGQAVEYEERDSPKGLQAVAVTEPGPGSAGL